MKTLCTAAALALACAPGPLSAEEHFVLIMTNGYQPAYLSVEVGDIVRFINLSNLPMTATATDKSWDSGVLAPRDEYVLTVRRGLKRSFENTAGTDTAIGRFAYRNATDASPDRAAALLPWTRPAN